MTTRTATSSLLPIALVLLLLAGAAAAAPAADLTAEAPAPSSPTASPDTIRWASSVGEVVFQHKLHTEEFGAECVSCHHETVAASLELPHAEYFDGFWVDCAVCHTGSATPAAAGKCVVCHPERTSGQNLEMPTVKVAIHRSCWKCHDRGTGSEASTQCGFCHQRPDRPQSQTTKAAPAPPAGSATSK
jgi:c(7)-type cytochrome triheme protein